MSRPRSWLLPVIVLALLHAYIGWRVLPDLPVGSEVRIAAAVFLLVSCVLMLLGLMARSIRPRSLSDRVAAAALFTAGLFSSLLVFTLLRDVVLLGAWLPLSAEYLRMLESASAVLVVGLAVFATVVGFANARRRARIKRNRRINRRSQIKHGLTLRELLRYASDGCSIPGAIN